MNKRQSNILELLTTYSTMEVVKLSKLLEVSQVTIRKDLDALETAGLIKRAHGYASLNSSDDINIRLAYNYETKLRIAKEAAKLVHDGDSVMIESGSCCALLARELAMTKKEITIITNSAFICDYVRKCSEVHLVLLGGDYQKESQVNVGPITRRCVESFFVDLLFIGTDGFTNESGFTGKNIMRSETVKDMVKQANQVIIVTDHQKFGNKGLVNLLPTSDVDGVITDQGIDLEYQAYLNEQEVKVIIVQKD